MKITEDRVRWAGIEEGCKNISVIELIDYLRKVDGGSGDYVKERQAWQRDYTVDLLLAASEQR